ncbi:ATP synthase subunit b precursor [compost metagenome]
MITGIWALINFLILAGTIVYFAKKPIGNALAQRQEAIAEALRLADANRKAAEDALAEQKRLLAEAETELAKITVNAKAMADALTMDLKAQAEAEAKRIAESAGKQIDLSKQSAIADLRREVGRMAFEEAERNIKAELNPDRQRELFGAFKERVGDRPLALK